MSLEPQQSLCLVSSPRVKVTCLSPTPSMTAPVGLILTVLQLLVSSSVSILPSLPTCGELTDLELNPTLLLAFVLVLLVVHQLTPQQLHQQLHQPHLLLTFQEFTMWQHLVPTLKSVVAQLERFLLLVNPTTSV